MSDEAYALSLAPSARRVLAQGAPRGLPVAAAAAVAEFLTGALLDKPHRVGKPLARELSGYHSARRGAYRVIYRIEQERHRLREVEQPGGPRQHLVDVTQAGPDDGGRGEGEGAAKERGLHHQVAKTTAERNII